MGAFWSGVDDADEKETRLYGVFGCLNAEHQTKFRVMVNGVAINLEYNHIFDFDKSTLATKEVSLPSGEIIPVKDSQIKEANVYHTEFDPKWLESVKSRTIPTVSETESLIDENGHVKTPRGYHGYGYGGYDYSRRRYPSERIDYDKFDNELEEARAKRNSRLVDENESVIGMDDCPTAEELDAELELAEEATQLAQNLLEITRYFADDEVTQVVLGTFDDSGALKNLTRKIDRFIPAN